MLLTMTFRKQTNKQTQRPKQRRAIPRDLDEPVSRLTPQNTPCPFWRFSLPHYRTYNAQVAGPVVSDNQLGREWPLTRCQFALNFRTLRLLFWTRWQGRSLGVRSRTCILWTRYDIDVLFQLLILVINFV